MWRQTRNREAAAAALLIIVLCAHMISTASAARGPKGGQTAAGAVHSRLPEAGRRERLYAGMGKPVSRKHADAHLEDGSGVEGLANIMRTILHQEAYDRARQGRRNSMHRFAGGEEPEDFCKDPAYRKRTLKAIKEAPFIGLFNDLAGIRRFEGSSVTYAKGAYWAIFDSLTSIGKIDPQFQFRGPGNALIHEEGGQRESQYEGLQYMPDRDTFLAVRESFDHEHHGLVPLTEEISINHGGSDWSLVNVCPVAWEGLESENKGWEGIHYYTKDGVRYLMGLCESNYCRTSSGEDAPGKRRGHGRLILTKYVEVNGSDTDKCHWEYLKTMKLPKEAYFMDYAGIAFHPDPYGRKVAVVSQEDAAVWVGEFDWEALEFVPGGKVYFFPRAPDCSREYCNVEGLSWLDAERLMFASDRSKPTQPFSCMGKDQSVHIMALP